MPIRGMIDEGNTTKIHQIWSCRIWGWWIQAIPFIFSTKRSAVSVQEIMQHSSQQQAIQNELFTPGTAPVAPPPDPPLNKMTPKMVGMVDAHCILKNKTSCCK